MNKRYAVALYNDDYVGFCAEGTDMDGDELTDVFETLEEAREYAEAVKIETVPYHKQYTYAIVEFNVVEIIS